MKTQDVEIFKSTENYRRFCRKIKEWLPKGEYRHILIKPNWVFHQTTNIFPIDAIVTSSKLIENVIDVCLELYPNLDRITIGDVPLQTCDWDTLLVQAGIDRLIKKYKDDNRIKFYDLRKERIRINKGYFKAYNVGIFRDPLGYKEVILDNDSYLDEIAENSGGFAVSDYPKKKTRSNHKKGYHRYLISGSVLDSDLFINLPKMKTHQKAGITGALKNIVGINGDKSFLVHHTEGKRGDEFAPSTPWLIKSQIRIREKLQGKSYIIFQIARSVWNLLKSVCNIETEIIAQTQSRNSYVGSGSWYGNDTIWRMIYDLNKIILYAPSTGGKLSKDKQRDYISIVDGIISGEGNGPLQPLPVETDVVIVSYNPFITDIVISRLIGFDWKKIPCLSMYRRFKDAEWINFNADSFLVIYNDLNIDSKDLPILKRFEPPPGWREHIELSE